MGCICLVSSPWASMETRSPLGSALRSCQMRVKCSRHSSNSARRCSSDSTTPESSDEVARSDQRVSLRLSSKGKSNRVASMRVVSSMDTVFTQSKGSPSGRESSTSAVRSLINGSILARLLGATTPVTVLRCTSCTGGSMAMKLLVSSAPSGRSASMARPRVMPLAEEKFL